MLRIASFTSLLLCFHTAIGATRSEPAGPNAGLKITATAGTAKTVVRVRSDGKIVVDKGAGKTQPDGREASQGATVAKIVGNGILDTAGAVEISLNTDGSVVGRGFRKPLHFNASDELLGEDGARMLWLSPDGIPQMSMDGKTSPLPLKVEGVNPGNRRMAVLLVLDFYLPKPVPEEAASPAPTPAPKAVPPAKTGSAQ